MIQLISDIRLANSTIIHLFVHIFMNLIKEPHVDYCLLLYSNKFYNKNKLSTWKI